MDSTARTATVRTYTRRSPWTPTDISGSRTAKYCHGRGIAPPFAAASISSSTIAHAARTASTASGVTSPRHRTASAGPGNGWRSDTATPRARATCRTSSLYRSRRGSTSFNRIVSGRPATLWWVLIRSRSCPPLSIQSGAIVPWTRNSARNPSASFSKTSMNFLPMTSRFFSGSETPLRAPKNASAARTTLNFARSPSSVPDTCSVSPFRISPVSTYTARSLSPRARLARTAAVVLSTPPEHARIARPSPTAFRTAATCSSMNPFASNTLLTEGLAVLVHPALHRLPVLAELLLEPLVAQGEDLDGEEGRVLPAVQAHRGDGHARRHLRHAEDRVEVHLPAHGHAHDGAGRVRGDRPGERRRKPRDRDEHLRVRRPHEPLQFLWSAVGGGHDHLVGDPELLEDLLRPLPHLGVRLAPEDDEDDRRHRWTKGGRG